ncbi:MAG: DUF502 domain-containing protein [Flavobacteriales bacterium]|nr:DUF502 domain-containing protein [Flavobacteriales bacterium]
MKNKYLRKFVSYVLNGLVITLPVFGTGYIIYKVFMWLDSIVPRLWYSDAELTKREDGFSGWGILVLLFMLFFMGWLGSLFINEQIKNGFEKLMNKIPGVNNLYNTISDIMGALVGNKKKFNQPVLVKVSDQLDLEMIGFITDTDLSQLGDISGKVAVYFPMSYSFAGHLMIVPVRHIKRIERNAVDIMKYAVSGGIVELDHEDEKHKGH